MKRPIASPSITAFPRLATHIWVHAQIRLCDQQSIPVAITRKGDPQAGAVVVRIVRGRDLNLLLRRHTLPDGASDWMPVAGARSPDDSITDESAATYVAKEAARDPDLWVMEVEDMKGRYWPDRPFRP
jgi:hypothetical protein